MKIHVVLMHIALIVGTVVIFSNHALCHIETEMPDAIAEVEYKIMLDLEPENIKNRCKLAMVYLRLGKLNKSEEELKIAYEKDPHNFHVLESYGQLELKQANYLKSIEYLEKAIETGKADSGTYYYIGIARQEVHDLDKAKKSLDIGLEKCMEENEKERAVSLDAFHQAIDGIKAKLNK